MRVRPRSALTAALTSLAAAAVVLAGCGTDAAAGPQQAVQERLDRGVSVEVTIEADPSTVDDAEAAQAVQEILDRQADGPLLVLSRSGDGQARGVVLGQGAVEARLVEDTAYLHLDAAALAEGDIDLPGPLGDLLPSDLPSPSPDDDEPAADPSAPGMPGDVGALLGALGEQDWIGVSGVTPEHLAELTGKAEETPSEQDMAAVEDLLAEHDLDSWTGLLDGYATVEGDGPWDITVDARALATAMEDVDAQAEVLLGAPSEQDGDVGDEDHGDHDVDPADLPDQVGGITIEAEDGVATRMVVDLATVHEALGEAMDHVDDPDADDDPAIGELLAAADARLVLTMVDVGERTDTPADAAVVDLELLDAMMQSGGMASLKTEN